MTDPITMKIWHLISAVLASSAISGAGAVITMRVDQAINEQRIMQNTIDINANRSEIRSAIKELHEVTLSLSQQVARLEGIK